MNIPFICQREDFFELLKWSYRSPFPQLCWLLLLERFINVRAHSPLSFQHMTFWCPFLDSYPNYTPLKYMYLFRITNQIRHIYLTQHNGLVTRFHNKPPKSYCLVIKSNLLFSVNLLTWLRDCCMERYLMTGMFFRETKDCQQGSPLFMKLSKRKYLKWLLFLTSPLFLGHKTHD